MRGLCQLGKIRKAKTEQNKMNAKMHEKQMDGRKQRAQKIEELIQSSLRNKKVDQSKLNKNVAMPQYLLKVIAFEENALTLKDVP